MDEEQKYFKGCGRKDYFDTHEAAMKTGAKRHLRVYKCLYCPGYHLTSEGAAIQRLNSLRKQYEVQEEEDARL